MIRSGWLWILLGGLALPSSAAPAKRAPAKKAARPAPAGPELPSRVPLSAPVARVNGAPIPLSRYVDALSLRYGPEVRESLVGEELLRQECKRRKLSATAKEIDAVVKRTFDDSVRRAGDVARLSQDLKRTRGWSIADYRVVIRDQAEAQVLREKLATALVAPDDIDRKEIEQAYADQKERFTQPDSVRISHILVRRPDEEDKDREAKDRVARVRAAGLLKKIQDGAAFDAVAKSDSEDKATSPAGGKIPTDIVRGANPFGAAFEAAVYSASPGLLPEVIASPNGFHVIRLDSKKDARTLPLTEVSDVIRTTLLAQRRTREMDELFVRLRTKAQVDTGRF